MRIVREHEDTQSHSSIERARQQKPEPCCGNDTSTSYAFLKTLKVTPRSGWVTPSEQSHGGAIGTFDLTQLADDLKEIENHAAPPRSTRSMVQKAIPAQ